MDTNEPSAAQPQPKRVTSTARNPFYWLLTSCSLHSVRKLVAGVLACLAAQNFAAAAPIQFAGRPSELVLGSVSERTLRIELAPLDDSGKPIPPVLSTVLVPFATTEQWRARELSDDKELRVGKLRVLVKAKPLAIEWRREDGTLVQRLVFDEAGGTNAGVAFRTEAPVFGLGEGAQQLDRRGAFYPMEPSWGGWNRAVLGSVV